MYQGLKKQVIHREGLLGLMLVWMKQTYYSLLLSIKDRTTEHTKHGKVSAKLIICETETGYGWEE